MNKKIIERQEKLKKINRTPFEILDERLKAICLSLKEDYPRMFNSIDVILNHIHKLTEIQCKSSNPFALLAGYYVIDYDKLEISNDKFGKLIKFDEKSKVFLNQNIKKEDIIRYCTMWIHVFKEYNLNKEIVQEAVKATSEEYKCKNCGNTDRDLFTEDYKSGDITCNVCGAFYANIRV